MNTSSRTKKVLAPLAVLLAAGALAVGSGATFTSASSNTISSVTAGSLEQTNSKDGKAIFNLSNMKPGDTVNGAVTITNSGTLPADFTVTETDATNTFTKNMLKLNVTEGTKNVYSGNFGDFEGKNLGVFAADEARTYTFTVTLDGKATNTEQGKSASAEYTWDAVQLDGETTNQ